MYLAAILKDLFILLGLSRFISSHLNLFLETIRDMLHLVPNIIVVLDTSTVYD